MKSLSVDQRPTFESDAYYDCRLTAPTQPEPDTNIVRERLELWEQGSGEYVSISYSHKLHLSRLNQRQPSLDIISTVLEVSLHGF